MDGPVRINWRVVTSVAAFLVVAFSISNYFGVADLSFPMAVVQQLTVWGTWLALTPYVLGMSSRHPLSGPPSASWLGRELLFAVGFSTLHGCVNGSLRWGLGIAAYDNLTAVLLANFTRSLGRNLLTYAVLVAGYQAVLYHRIVRERDQRAARLELDLAAMKLEGLEGRLRPHFLFNTLNTIAALVRENPAAAETMIGQLAELLRATLRADSQLVPLGDELALVEQYLAIEQVRFADRLRVSVSATDEAKLGLVPQLIIQPLVENAVRHGIAPRERGGRVDVSATCALGRLTIIVEDDGVGMGNAPAAASGTGIGLGSVRSRLAYLFGGSQRFDVQETRGGGTRITIEIPWVVTVEKFETETV